MDDRRTPGEATTSVRQVAPPRLAPVVGMERDYCTTGESVISIGPRCTPAVNDDLVTDDNRWRHTSRESERPLLTRVVNSDRRREAGVTRVSAVLGPASG